METKNTLTVTTRIHAPVADVWEYWTNPSHITQWSFATEEWHTPRATNDLRAGGHFSSRMEAKDGSMGFDFGGVYDVVTPHEYIEYTLGDNRKVKITFTSDHDTTTVTESFEAENTNPLEMQQAGWQAIMDNFKKYVESK